MTINKVSSGDRFAPSSEFHNILVDLVDQFRREDSSSARKPDARNNIPVVKIKPISMLNTRGSAILQFNVVGLGDLLVSPQDNEIQFRESVSAESASPSTGGRFAIAIDGAPDNNLFSAVISGVVQVKINRTSTSHDYAASTSGQYDYLTSGTSGLAEILWVDDLPALAIGETVHTGTGAPGGGTGSDGDYYKDTVGEQYYGPKTAGSWGAAIDYKTGICWAIVVLDQAGATASDSFKTIAVSGQSDVVADSATDTLTLAEGSNITITTNAGTDTITIAAANAPVTSVNGQTGAVTCEVEEADGTVEVTTTVGASSTTYGLSARVADATYSGIVSTTTQQFTGSKEIIGTVTSTNGGTSASISHSGVNDAQFKNLAPYYDGYLTFSVTNLVVNDSGTDRQSAYFTLSGYVDSNAGNLPSHQLYQPTIRIIDLDGTWYGQYQTEAGLIFKSGVLVQGSSLSVAEANIASQAVAPAKLKDADFGDFSVSSGVATIEADAVTNAKLANAAAYSFKANLTSGSANPTDVTLADLAAEAAPASGDYFLAMLADGSFAKVDYDDLPGGGAGDVTAASTFGTDNRLIRSDGTTKGVQASGITVDDSDNVTGVLTLNKVTVTAPATGSTLTIADGKTATISNTITITATDGSTLAIGSGGALGTAAYTASSAYDASGAAAAAQAASQPLDATLTALAGVNWAANSLAIGSGSDTVAQVTFAANTFPARASTGNLVAKPITDFALTILDDADAAAVRTTIGAGTGGGSVTSVDVSGGSTGLSTSGGPVTSSGTITLAGTLVVANGGTGVASTTAYAVLCGGTTSTGALQSVASVGTAGQVLTSNGAGALPTFQTVSGGSGNRVSVVTETAKSTTFTAVWGEYYPCSGTSYTITLPTASGNAGKICAFRVTASGTLTLDGNSSETVGGRTTLALITGDYIELQSDGTNVQIAVFTHADWVSYTPTINGVSSNPTKGGTRTELCLYKRDGRDMLMQYLYRQTSAGAAGSGYYLHVLPRSASVDTSFVQTGDFSSFGNVGSLLGAGDAKTTGVVASIGVYAYSTTDLILAGFYDGGGAGGGGVGSAFFNMGLSEIIYTFTARVPISGW